MSRCELYPKVLIRPRCGCCGAELMLGRSGKYASFCCLNGIHGKRGCTFKGYKALRIVEGAILGELRRRIMTPEFLGAVLEEANRFLAAGSARPLEDGGPLEAEIRSTKAKRDRLVKLLDEEGDQDLRAVADRIREHERRLKELRARLGELKARNSPTPGPMAVTDLETILSDLGGLLGRDLAAAAPVLRSLTGPIVVEQVVEAGKKRPTWVARFTVDATPVLADLAASRDHPTRETWEYLATRGWTMPREVVARLEATPSYAYHAAKMSDLVERGASILAASSALGIPQATAKAALEYARAGGPIPTTTRTTRIAAAPPVHPHRAGGRAATGRGAGFVRADLRPARAVRADGPPGL